MPASPKHLRPHRNGHRKPALGNARKTGGLSELAAGEVAAPVSSTPKTLSIIDRARIVIARRARYNPLRNLTPDLVTTQLDAFRMGYLWQFALTQDAMSRRDPVILSVKPKREKSVARYGFEVNTKADQEDNVRAEQHRAAIQYFFDNLTATDALDMDDVGGFNVLTQQMLRAESFKYQVHEIVWEPRVGAVTYTETPGVSRTDPATGEVTKTEPVKRQMDGYTATFRAVPLWFFECITGQLRYLRQFGELYGQPMEEGGWLVTTGSHLMEAGAVAYTYKHLLALKDWAAVAESWGDTKAWGRTSAGVGTDEWNTMVQLLKDIATPGGTGIVKGTKDTIDVNLIEGKLVQGGESCFERMIELMDRYISTLWRGGDLSTLSRGGGLGQSGHGTGSNRQAEESVILETHDAEHVSEVLNVRVVRPLIRYLFDEEPLAYVRINCTEKQNVDSDLAIDNALAAGGAKQKMKTVAERYGRQVENPDDEFEAAVQPAQANPDDPADTPAPMRGGKGEKDNPDAEDAAELALANEADARDLILFSKAVDADVLAPMRVKYADLLQRLQTALALADGPQQVELEHLRPELEALRDDLPSFLKSEPQAATVLAGLIAKSFINGAAESRPVKYPARHVVRRLSFAKGR